ncbi:MAG: tripartite tricarboxylate transporter TctB family protein [Reyranella sp.]|uniref:tripartite tricarboxylate transporter TctB family protein n=1 Tax=Reyranella sp. TaxID=1929291 RepID=UPI001ACE687F|nr:tripartite tricarboxylate transporter TctB family protein [Reyranella sp.]MBN9091228.1 tripartite tricarboxylate transporter TctB family protein [Reyranella sp.]
MSDPSKAPGSPGPGQRIVEMGVALFILALGALAMIGSLRVGIGWGAEGPKSGFFPFWVGLIVVLASARNFWRAIAISPARLFAEWGQIAQVRKVVIPMAIYVALVPFFGIYVASALLIAGFMRWLGRYGWLLTLAVAILLPILIYVTFEDWFLVPLPKGPLEDWLGL